jgi:hypothetical protein
MLATIEKFGLTTEQLGEAYSSDDYAALQQVLNKLDKKRWLNSPLNWRCTQWQQ